MGGFAVVIDWERPVDPREVDPMMALVPHRTTGGVRVHATPHAVLAEGRTANQVDDAPWSIATLGPLAIVGDIRLFDTSRLRAAAGGEAATKRLDDRQLLLAAYRRKGVDVLDAVDGDFAFVIWDDVERRALAVRDLFAVKPIFYEETPTGIRLASEVKQLTAASTVPIEPELSSVVGYVTYAFDRPDLTFVRHVKRIGPASCVMADPSHVRTIKFWQPAPTASRPIRDTLVEEFRERVLTAVDRRLRSSTPVVSQLSGGLDSSSILASASILARRGTPMELITASAVYDLPSMDESAWIRDITRMHPFRNVVFTPSVATLAELERDMGTVDGPFVDPVRDLNHATAAIAADHGAPLVLSGNGGDHLLDQHRYLADMLRRGSLGRFAVGTWRSSKWSGRGVVGVASVPIRQLAPAGVRALRARLPRQGHAAPTLLRPIPEARDPTAPVTAADFGFGSWTQNAIAASLFDPLYVFISELQATVYSTHGVDLSHPFLDRDLVEFILSIDPIDLPFDGRSKTLARRAFADTLPASVLERRTKTTGDEYVVDVLRPQRTEYRSRYPSPPGRWGHLVDTDAYATWLDRYDAGNLTFTELMSLWRLWHVFSWGDLINKETSHLR